MINGEFRGKMDKPELITTNARSESTKKMWEKRKNNHASGKVLTERKLDWHLLLMALGVFVPLAVITIGSYMSLVSKITECQRELSHEISQVNAEIVKIQTVLIIKGIAPPELFSSENPK